ncbi:hypothetical protein HN371_09930 [Candidatus Poribacteria bacterium]|nr:hypothetical protein [Candidatus Poribacteria bacterium]MBT5710692.1 hypothetical protein [Candidatus Poribacteria bacterium]MBT7099324.1 hypothetical protein [Candidatus Poribacteria bacterium]MBT7809474.1 hypothetical protein [Candidatus Poribacteria bacterium]
MSRYTLHEAPNGVALATPDGRTVFHYLTEVPPDSGLAANSACCFYPLLTPSGQDVVEMAPDDHPHHRGVFLTWHSLSSGRCRADFWGWDEFAPTRDRVIVNRGIDATHADADRAELRIANDWLAGGQAMISEELTVGVSEARNAYVIDLAYALTPATDVTLDRAAFGGLCAKCRKDGQATYRNSRGVVTLDDPHYLTPDTGWPSEPWYSYAIALKDGSGAELAVIDRPGNPPTLWHNLAPISMVNPCIVAPGEVALAKGQTLSLRYRLVVADGDLDAGWLDELARDGM